MLVGGVAKAVELLVLIINGSSVRTTFDFNAKEENFRTLATVFVRIV